MENWVTSYVKKLVSNPEAVSITPTKGIKTMVFNITVASEDLSIFNRNQKRLLKALNTVTGLAGSENRTRYVLKVSE